MIPLEKQVCTLERAKKLKELGVKQESYFRHYLDSIGGHHTTPNRIKWYDEDSMFAAFTVAELGVMLPPHYFTYPQTGGTFNTLAYKLPEGIIPSGVLPTCYNAEAEARAAMLIHLIESNLVTVEQINEKL